MVFGLKSAPKHCQASPQFCGAGNALAACLTVVVNFKIQKFILKAFKLLLSVNELHCRIRVWVIQCCVPKLDLLVWGSRGFDVCLL